MTFRFQRHRKENTLFYPLKGTLHLFCMYISEKYKHNLSQIVQASCETKLVLPELRREENKVEQKHYLDFFFLMEFTCACHVGITSLIPQIINNDPVKS